MGYIGKVPADVLIDPHVDSASIVDSTIVTADIANDAITSAKLAQNSVDSSELIDGSVDNSHLAGSIAVNKTLLTAGTGLTLSTNTLSVDAAQSQITSVGTLSSLTTSGSTGSNYIGSFTNTSATGWGLFIKGGADNADYTLRVQDKDAGDLLSVKAGGRIGINTNDPAYPLDIVSTINNGASLAIRGDVDADGRFSGIQFGDNGTTSYSKGGIFYEGKDAYARGNLHFALEGGTGSDNADLSDARMTITYGGNVGIGTTSPQTVGGGKTLTIAGDAPEITLVDNATNTPYAWIATNDYGSLILAADRAGEAANSYVRMDVDGTEAMRLDSSQNATFAGNITQSKSGNLRITQTAGGSGESSLVLTANNSTGDSFVRWETNSTTFCIGLDNSDGDKFIISAGSDPHSNSVINIQPDGSNIAIDKITSFNAPAVFNGGNITGSLTGITSSGVGGDLLFYSNGSANARLESSGDFRVVNGLKLYAGDSSLRARLHWHSFKTTLGRRYYHFHTNIPWGSSAQMYSLHFLGHAYNDSKAINTTLAFYNYDNGSVLAIGSTGTHSATVYESANDKIVLVLDLGAGNTYYSGLTISSYHTAQGVAIPSITEQGVSDNATGVY